MDNPAVEIWASLAKFKLKSLNLYFWLDWIPWLSPIYNVKSHENVRQSFYLNYYFIFGLFK